MTTNIYSIIIFVIFYLFSSDIDTAFFVLTVFI